MNHDAPKANPTSSYHPRPRQREAVLIIAHGDGWLECFAERHVDVKIVMPPYVRGAEGERVTDEWLDLTLPKRFADLRWPILRRAAEMLRVIRPTGILRREADLALLRTLDRIGDHGREGRRVWTL